MRNRLLSGNPPGRGQVTSTRNFIHEVFPYWGLVSAFW